VISTGQFLYKVDVLKFHGELHNVVDSTVGPSG
jgi:hypothetical protein